MRIAGLFAGIGGIELGFHQALGSRAHTELLCEWWEPAQQVLASRFPGVDLHPDVRELRDLPRGLDVLAAGFPCTDLSQAGRTAGIDGQQSGLVSHAFDALRLLDRGTGDLPWLMVENVPNMLALDRGKAMAYLVGELEALGYRWAYRVVDTRFTGLPQRRRRVILLASRTDDPRAVLFAEDAEALQGFERGWTDAGTMTRKRGTRFKLVGNAVTTRVARWVAESLVEPGGMNADSALWARAGAWPTAAWGESGAVHRVDVFEFPRHLPYEHLSDVVDLGQVPSLSDRALNGFRSRLLLGNLGRHPGFRDDVEDAIAIGVTVVDLRNDGSPVSLVTGPPSPPAGDTFNYDSMVVRMGNEYDTTFSRV